MKLLCKKIIHLCDMEQDILNEIAEMCSKLEYIRPKQLKGAKELCQEVSKTPSAVKKEILLCENLSDFTKIYDTYMKYGITQCLVMVLLYPLTYLKQLYKIPCDNCDVYIF